MEAEGGLHLASGGTWALQAAAATALGMSPPPWGHHQPATAPPSPCALAEVSSWTSQEEAAPTRCQVWQSTGVVPNLLPSPGSLGQGRLRDFLNSHQIFK